MRIFTYSLCTCFSFLPFSLFIFCMDVCRLRKEEWQEKHTHTHTHLLVMSVPSSTFCVCVFFFLLFVVNTEVLFFFCVFCVFFFLSLPPFFLSSFFFFCSLFVLLLIVPRCRGGYAMVSPRISLLLSCFGCTRFFFSSCFRLLHSCVFFSYHSFVSRARDDDDDNDNDVRVNWPLLFR